MIVMQALNKKPILKYQAQAVEMVKKKISEEAKILLFGAKDIQLDVKYINKDRYAILRFYSPERHMDVRYGILFKKERWHSFYKFFPKESGEGETINVAHWMHYFKDCEKIIYVYQNTHSLEYYWINPIKIELLKEDKRLYIHLNKSDSVSQIAFSTSFLREL